MVVIPPGNALPGAVVNEVKNRVANWQTLRTAQSDQSKHTPKNCINDHNSACRTIGKPSSDLMEA